MSCLCRIYCRRLNVFLKNEKYQFLYYCSLQSKIKFDKKGFLEIVFQPKYNPKDVESQWYEWWESQGFFKAKKPENDSFIVLLPPPNITGTLHLGHALTATIQDVILRWKRMKGESVLWIPGIDHAGIATQVIFEKHLQHTLGVSRHSLGRKKFVEEIWKWKEEKGGKIVQQLRDLGASVDWEKMKFTLDPVHSEIVTKSFIKLHDEGLIYRKKALVNWSVALNSSISDVEVDWVAIPKKTKFSVPGYSKPVNLGVLYKIAYKLCDEDGEIVVATTRPETMLGDTAVAVHPDNPKYANFKGKYVWHPFRKVKIPVIVDEFVDNSLGTSAVKITPSHSLVDFEVGLRHNLESIEVINENGLINKIGCFEKFHNLKRFDARLEIINELKKLDLFRGFHNHEMKVPVCSRSGDIVELLLKDQWFLKCEKIAEKAINAMEAGNLKIQPENYQNVWREWLSNIKDWNLSRQLWWGHQIPMYECKSESSAVWVAALSLNEAKEKACQILKASPESVIVVRDPDVLDTWFSSGLLPLNIFPEGGATNKPPISLMVTGHDILFFWVARMVMLSLQLTGKLPFHNVLLHSLVRDAEGRKMSKSLGNVIHPEDIINGISANEMKHRLKETEKQGLIENKHAKQSSDILKRKFVDGIPECGADALRFTLCTPDVLGEFINFDLALCKSSRHFCNKIWQAMNYFFKITEEYKTSCDDSSIIRLDDIKTENLSCFDKWILSRLAATVKTVEENIPAYKFYLVTSALRLFFVEDFCSIYLESTKSALKNTSSFKQKLIVSVFFECMETSLRLLSPFMPFICEHLYHSLPMFNNVNRFNSITLTQFPSAEDWNKWRDPDLDQKVDEHLAIVSNLRLVKIEFQMLKEEPNVFLKCGNEAYEYFFSDAAGIFNYLAGVKSITKVDEFSQPNVIEKVISKHCVAYIEHPYNKEALSKILSQTIKREENARKNLQKLENAKFDWDKMTPSEKGQHLKNINNLKETLLKIEECKRTIENCNRTS